MCSVSVQSRCFYFMVIFTRFLFSSDMSFGFVYLFVKAITVCWAWFGCNFPGSHNWTWLKSSEVSSLMLRRHVTSRLPENRSYKIDMKPKLLRDNKNNFSDLAIHFVMKFIYMVYMCLSLSFRLNACYKTIFPFPWAILKKKYWIL